MSDARPGSSQLDWSPEADALLDLAAKEARSSGSGVVRPGHILLALLRQPDEVMAEAFTGLRLTHERVRDVVGPAEGAPPPSEQAPEWSRAARLVCERAEDEALYRGADKVRPIHLLVGLDPFEEGLSKLFSSLRPRLRPHDFQRVVRRLPSLDE